MVQISIHAVKNLNHGGRFYPYSGYLGLTKVLVEGVARTRIEDDHKLLPAFSITVSVKCYEARTKLTDSRVNVLADITQTLWSSPTEECSEIGDMDLPFRLVLPTNIGGYSTLSFPDYKIFWRLEAVINHPPQFGLGMRQIRTYELALTRYNVPSRLPSPPPTQQRSPDLPGYSLSPPSSRIPQFFYRITDAEHAVGPGDHYPVEVSLVLNQHPVVQLQSLSVSLERRLELFEASGSSTSAETVTIHPTPSPSTASMASISGIFANLSSSNSQSNMLTRKRSASPTSESVLLPAKSMTSSLVSAQTTEFKPDETGGITASVNLPLPARPSLSHWPIGESLKTDLAKIYFVLRIKMIMVGPSGSIELELEPLEVHLAPISQEQRAIATAKIVRRKANSKSASSSRRTSPAPSTSGSSKAEPDTPPPVPTLKPSRSAIVSAPNSRPRGSGAASAHFVENLNASTSATSRTLRNSTRTSSKRRPQTSSGSPSGSSSSVPANTRNARTSLMGITTPLDPKRMPSHIVLAWEEELHRIVTRSKRKSDDMWGENADYEHLRHRSSRPRRGIAAAPPSAFTHPYHHPSDAERLSRYSIARDPDNTIIYPPLV